MQMITKAKITTISYQKIVYSGYITCLQVFSRVVYLQKTFLTKLMVTYFSGNVLDVSDKNKKAELQNMVRSLDGIPAVLGACGPNHVNQIRNWAIQTINQVKMQC